MIFAKKWKRQGYVSQFHVFRTTTNDPNLPFDAPGGDWYWSFALRRLVTSVLKLEGFENIWNKYLQF